MTLSPQLSRSLYVMYRDVQELIQKHNGLIFGGYPRDMILHDINAAKFYVEYSTEDYQDPACAPELADRFLVPKDIDCFMSTETMEKFMVSLNDHYTIVSQTENVQLLRYMDSTLDASLRLKKVRVEAKISPPGLRALLPHYLRNVSISIDIVNGANTSKLDPPYGLVDFYCNGIILTPDNEYRLSKHMYNITCALTKRKLLDKVIEDISARKAVAAIRVPLYRTTKMMQRNWRIEADKYTLFKEPTPEDVCCICLQELKGYQLKRHCCNIRYHSKCYKTMTTFQDYNMLCPGCHDKVEPTEVCSSRTIKLW